MIEVICDILQELAPNSITYRSLIKYVQDRPGHDVRYAIDANKIKNELVGNQKKLLNLVYEKLYIGISKILNGVDGFRMAHI